jgi:TorA maturation chaperone TorD
MQVTGNFPAAGDPAERDAGAMRTADPIGLEAPAADGDTAQRADTYGLLARVLGGPPDIDLLYRLGSIAPATDHETPKAADGPMGRAWRRLGESARNLEAGAVRAEYHNLFIGVTQGEVMPYGSWYQAGSLMDRPLVRLRSDLRRLGFALQSEVREPEDHAAALCELMGLLTLQTSDAEGEARAQAFYQAHLRPWLPSFFVDLQRAPSACFYAAVGDLGEQFMELERDYLSLARASQPAGASRRRSGT